MRRGAGLVVGLANLVNALLGFTHEWPIVGTCHGDCRRSQCPPSHAVAYGGHELRVAATSVSPTGLSKFVFLILASKDLRAGYQKNIAK